MKKAYILTSVATACLLALTACHHDSLEDRAEHEVADYTQRYCPTPYASNQRTDSITFTRSSHTFHFNYTLRDVADNPEIISQNKAKLKQALQEDLDKSTQNKTYKEAGYRFHYVFRSQKTGKVLFEQTLVGKK